VDPNEHQSDDLTPTPQPPEITPTPRPSPLMQPPPASRPGLGEKMKKALGPVGVAIVALFAKFKFALLAGLKFLPLLLKTGGTMILHRVYAFFGAFGLRSDLFCCCSSTNAGTCWRPNDSA
jgi:hypothetical protein